MPLRLTFFTPLSVFGRLARRAASGHVLLWAMVLLALALTANAAQPKLDLQAGTGAVVQTPEVRAELVAYAPQGVSKGAPLELGLLLKHQPGWHTYWKNPGDSGLPTELRWNLPEGLQTSALHWPTPHKINIGRLANFGFEDTVLLPVTVTVAPAFRPTPGTTDIAVRLSASWLVCRTECIPQEGEFELRLPLQGSVATQRALFDAARAARPTLLAGKVQAQLDGDSLLLTAKGLPAQWQGKAISVFPEAVEVFVTAASPAPSDQVHKSQADSASAALPQASTQTWQGAVWSARLPLSPLRSTSPAQIGMLLALDNASVQALADVSGTWPDKTTSASLDSALPAAALGSAATPTDTSGLAWALVAAFLGGLILNLMPCVFPVLAIKVLGFASHSDQGGVSRRVIGLSYTAGVVLSMAALGGALLALRAGGEQLGWGFQLQSPAVVSALAVLFTLIALNLLGLLEWGSLVPSGLAGMQLRHPAADAALSGVLAVAVASPCTAPFMGASLGLALTLPAWQAMAIFVALGLGLALPFALASALPQLARLLPQPGVWMVHLRQFMAFPMAATVLWLLWVLGHLGGLDAAASMAVLLWCLALGVWALNLQGRSRWVFATLALALLLALLPAVGPKVLTTQALATPAEPQANSAKPSLGAWQTWSAQRVQTELQSGKPVFVDFTAAWCITCQYNKQTTLSQDAVLQDFAAKQVTLLRADWTQRDPAITKALSELGRSGVPVYVLYAPGKTAVVMSEILSAADLRAALRDL
jgi:thiol:disulfide interchange protein DsbD